MIEDHLSVTLSALHAGATVLCYLGIVATVLIALHWFDRWRAERHSPGQWRNRHFGGV